MESPVSITPKEPPEQELNRPRKEKAKLNFQKEADKAKISNMKKGLKKDVQTITISEEQRKLLSSMFPDIDSVFK